MPQASLVIPAAGCGRRFLKSRSGPDTDVPPLSKVVADVAGRPVLAWTLERFASIETLVDAVVAVSADALEEVREAFGDRLGDRCPLRFVAGGEDRMTSVAAALDATDGRTELVIIHDAVRPLIRPAIIEEALRMAVEYDGAVVGRKVDHTVKSVPTGVTVSETVPREGLWLAQTPQVFRRDIITQAFARRHEVVGTVTDDAQLVEAMGYRVAMVEGDAANFKITTYEDLRMCEALLAAGWPFEE